MEFSFQTLFLLPIALGLLGFIEPCTVGAHLIFLNRIGRNSVTETIAATILFVAVRTVTVGIIGIIVVALGQRVIAAQTTLWLVFGVIYILIALAYFMGRADWVKRPFDLALSSGTRKSNPVVLGFIFGLNIPACAAPILFGLMGLVSSTGSFTMGFVAMALFGFALSAPLAVFAIYPGLTRFMERTGRGGSKTRWIMGAVFIGLGAWSIWFGLFVDPADWTVS